MRNILMIVLGFGLMAAVSGAVYCFFPKQPAVSAALMPNAPPSFSPDSHVRIVSAENPLLTADASQFGRWVPMYPIRCGQIVFDNGDPQAPNFSFCIDEIRKRVATATGRQLSGDDVLDSRVKAHWHEVMEAIGWPV